MFIPNPSLTCILVDDVGYANTNFTAIDAGHVFSSSSCDMTTIPDDNFEAYLEANSMGNGVANDNQVFTHNISSVTSLSLGSVSLTDLTGIEGFVALETLSLRDNTTVTNVDVTSVSTLKYLDLHGATQVNSLNVNGITSLEWLFITETQLTSIDVSTNTGLTILSIGSAPLTSLDVSNNINIETFEFTNNTTLSDIDLSNNPNLVTVTGYNSSLQTLDLRNGNNATINDPAFPGSTSLSCIEVDDVNYATANWTQIESGTRFTPDCSYIYMPDDNFETYLETHTPAGAVVTIGDVNSMGNGVMDNYVVPTRMEVAITLDVNNQNISDLTGIEGFTALESLIANANNLSALDLSSNTTLTSLNLEGNSSISTISISALTALQVLNLANTGISTVDVSSNTALTTVNLEGSSICFFGKR